VADLAEAIATLSGVRGTSVEKGELVAHAERDALLPLMMLLRDDEPGGTYVLLIGWRDPADRLAFRESADYERWRAAVHGYLATPPTARHLTLVCGSPARRDGG